MAKKSGPEPPFIHTTVMHDQKESNFIESFVWGFNHSGESLMWIRKRRDPKNNFSGNNSGNGFWENTILGKHGLLTFLAERKL